MKSNRSQENLEFGKERIMSYLPLSHVASQIVDIILSILVGAEVIFAEPTALQGTFVENLREVKPTFFFGVPRIWEKIEEKIKAIEEKNSSFKNKKTGCLSLQTILYLN